MNKILYRWHNVESNISKELVRQYMTPDGETVKEVGPIVCDFHDDGVIRQTTS
jgi:hypothetical protein